MKLYALAWMCLLAAVAAAQGSAGTGAHLPSQAAADLIKNAAGADGAFLAAGLVNETFQTDNLATVIQFPTEGIVVLHLTGSDIRQALERSVSLYPQPNGSFLQLSGITAEFSASAPSGHRITNATIAGAPIDAARTYNIAMPSSLGQGNLGYFKIWDKTKIAKTLTGTTMESVLSGKSYSATAPRWVSRS
jgi:2',3'-cyclic-nucleotide 2'-phosphodiesterase (5'-nucleotidase family)